MTEIEEWTPEAAAAIGLCEAWAEEVTAAIPCTIYLFGSAIYNGGDQFDIQSSDLDLVVVFDEDLDATERAERLHLFSLYKAKLELRMVPSLRRTNCKDPGVSIVPITALELTGNIHKSGAPRFFDKNIFLDLATGKQSLGLPGAGLGMLPYNSRQALEYVQKVRNQFLAVSANLTGGISPFDEVDPLPKPLARAAAQLDPNA
ncbi:MAG: nucleotidyltransferase domain-containing protein, partial [Mesorhizobium sp.]